MRFAKFVIIATVAVFLSLGYMVYGEETKQESKPEAAPPVAQEMKQAPAGEVKTEAKEAKHEHGMGVVNRFVAVVGADGIQHVEITGGEYYFDPNYIVLKVNVPAEFKVKKAAGYVPHDMVVKAPEAGIDFKVDLKDEWKTVSFTPTKVGKYEIYCDKKLLWFKSHKDRGMDGYIEVVP